MAQYKSGSFVVVSRKHLICYQTDKLSFFTLAVHFLAWHSLALSVKSAVHGITSFSKGMCAALNCQGRLCRRLAMDYLWLLVLVECKAEKAFAEPCHLCFKWH